jgi:lysylphosphatidylglycerol synthetase-like protein (DUF2156 family)
MWTFIISGALYLTGVAIVLVLKPSFMFTPDGTWKEFGIGQDPSRYTNFPFWLFCLIWAVISYVIVLMTLPLFDTNESEVEIPVKNVRNRKPEIIEDSNLVFDDELEDLQSQLPKGYYILNKKASRIAGVPKYVHMGEN